MMDKMKDMKTKKRTLKRKRLRKIYFFSLPERDQKTGIRKDFYRWKTDRIYKKRTFRCQTKNRDRISKSG